MTHKRRGIALIFNQEMFFWYLAMPSRHGTNADKENLERRLGDLGFDVRAYDNLKAAEVMELIHEAATSNHADADCFLCVFLSHGENDHVFAYDAKIQIQDLTGMFKGDKCQSLVGKPKIFIIQVVVDAGAIYTLPAGADFIMCYSVAEGYYSHRETVRGSWYIQDLCELMQRYGSTLEFTELLTLVNRKVSTRSVANCADRTAIGKKQVPCFASMLTKKLYLRSKNK
ncbi:UNVERIFIED_CONTAM: hypothetical protein FKN15_025554 [Acipenser sinensis]